MEYDVKIGGYNLLADLGWHIQDKTIGAPELKTHTVEIPGRDGVIDFTSYLRGYAIYGNREIIVDIVHNGGAAAYAAKQSQLFQLFHGRKLDVIFSDDSNYMYRGRVSVGPVKLEGEALKCTLTIDAEPYKISVNPVASTTYNVTTNGMESAITPTSTISGLTKGKIYIPCVRRVSNATGTPWYTIQVMMGEMNVKGWLKFNIKIEDNTEFVYEGRAIVLQNQGSVAYGIKLVDYQNDGADGGQTFGSAQTIIALKEAVL